MKRIFIIIFSFLIILLPKSSFAEESNEVTFISNTFDYKPLPGFKYEVKGENKNYFIDLTENSEAKISLPDGSYVVTEVLRPDGYEKSLDMSLNLPYKTSDGKDSRTIKVHPKHNKVYPGSVKEDIEKITQEKPKEEKYPHLQNIGLETSASDFLLSNKEKVFALMCLSLIALYFVIRYRKKSKINLK